MEQNQEIYKHIKTLTELSEHNTLQKFKETIETTIELSNSVQTIQDYEQLKRKFFKVIGWKKKYTTAIKEFIQWKRNNGTLDYSSKTLEHTKEFIQQNYNRFLKQVYIGRDFEDFKKHKMHKEN